MTTIRDSIESARGCGYRSGGRYYFVLHDGEGFHCGKLPIPLTVCPTCGSGFKHSRGYSWINPQEIAPFKPCAGKARGNLCNICPMTQIDRALMIWVGAAFYPTPSDFLKEAQAKGISRHIKAPPRGFDVGEDWVFLAHINGIQSPEDEHANPDGFIPALFHAFRPQAIEYVVNGDEGEEKLDELEERGIELVNVIKDTEQQTLFN